MSEQQALYLDVDVSKYILVGHKYASSPQLSYWEYDDAENKVSGPFEFIESTCHISGEYFYESSMGRKFEFLIINKEKEMSLIVDGEEYSFLEHNVEFSTQYKEFSDIFSVSINGRVMHEFCYFRPFWRKFFADSMVLDYVYPLRYAQQLFDSSMLGKVTRGRGVNGAEI